MNAKWVLGSSSLHKQYNGSWAPRSLHTKYDELDSSSLHTKIYAKQAAYFTAHHQLPELGAQGPVTGLLDERRSGQIHAARGAFEARDARNPG
jgi:hypothetical protein